MVRPYLEASPLALRLVNANIQILVWCGARLMSRAAKGQPRWLSLSRLCTTSLAVAFAAVHNELNSCVLSSRSCACEAAVSRAESPHALSALRSSFFCSVPAPAPRCFAVGVAAGVGRAPPAGAGGGGREAGWGGLAEGLGLGYLGLGLALKH